ncbi:MAG: CD225/dispanin family protein [Prevotella sp.]|nr:CD225/dispanin family protein [Prevotella sp.]
MNQSSSEYPYHSLPPKTWLVESIVVTLCCCMPLGVVGIINAAKVETLYNGGRYTEANHASEEARKWTLIALVAGLATQLGYGALHITNIINAFSNF